MVRRQEYLELGVYALEVEEGPMKMIYIRFVRSDRMGTWAHGEMVGTDVLGKHRTEQEFELRKQGLHRSS